MSQEPEQTEPQTLVESRADAAAQAIGQMVEALVALLLVVVTLLAQAIRALLLVAPALLKATCVALPVYAACKLYPLLAHAYGGDVPAILLAGAVVIYVPAALFTAARTWGALMLAGLAELGLAAALPHAPPLLLALVPVTIIAAVILYRLSTEAQQGPQENTDPAKGGAEGETDEQVTRQYPAPDR